MRQHYSPLLTSGQYSVKALEGLTPSMSNSQKYLSGHVAIYFSTLGPIESFVNPSLLIYHTFRIVRELSFRTYSSWSCGLQTCMIIGHTKAFCVHIWTDIEFLIHNFTLFAWSVMKLDFFSLSAINFLWIMWKKTSIRLNIDIVRCSHRSKQL